jgi:ferrochelatase
VHPKFISMIRELILERTTPQTERRALGSLGPREDACEENCCPAPQKTGRPIPVQR